MSADADSAHGFDRAPDRYMAQGRETIDRMRDHCHDVAERFDLPDVDFDARCVPAGDMIFAVFCDLQAMKYRDRAGRKRGAAYDPTKARWYEEMAAHVRGLPDARDPRHARIGFTPYERQDPEV